MEGLKDRKSNQESAPHTRYLAITEVGPSDYIVEISKSPPVTSAGRDAKYSRETRYSPILPAYLIPRKGPPASPATLKSVALLFANCPYKILGTFRSQLSPSERPLVYFTLGLASIIFLNFSPERIKALRRIAGDCPLEYWPLRNGKLRQGNISFELSRRVRDASSTGLGLPASDNPELSVYIEQIAASMASLQARYEIYFPEELETLRQISKHVTALIKLFHQVQESRNELPHRLSIHKDRHAIIAALVDISATLSYAVTQGTSGSLPVLSQRSPFPHHSLFGVGGAVRALNKYTRYLEAAFTTRSASQVIGQHYSRLKHLIPASLQTYRSGPEYKFDALTSSRVEYFDSGADMKQEDDLPLITYFSLRHGFMELKYSVTAASETLTAETLPQWTLMTLSHEIMHSRVKTIFQALFGQERWDVSEGRIITRKMFDSFRNWIQSRTRPKKRNVIDSLRNTVLNFCYALDRSQNIVPEADKGVRPPLTVEKLNDAYASYKDLAIELFVHFHDFYFVYACQPKVYIRSIWASWIKVAQPYDRPLEYLTRSLATVASGTGLETKAAFDYAKDILLDGLASLEAANIRSPLFGELRRILNVTSDDFMWADFHPAYYLIDTIRLYFASRKIASKIDRLETDPFADGSSATEKYTANIYVYGEDQTVSPVRYSVSTLCKSLSRELPLADQQWLSAWNLMVISS